MTGDPDGTPTDPPPPPDHQPAAVGRSDSKAIASLALGIMSLVLNFLFIPGILAIVFGAQGRRHDGKAKAGFILGIIGTVLSVVFLLASLGRS